MSEKYVVTWDMLQIHARKLAARLMPSEQWKGIIAVSRGGLVPGALLARELGIRHVDTVCISSYDHDNQRELTVLKRAEGDGEGFIVIDDLVDTGGTAVAIREMYPKAHFVTIFAKPAGRPLHARPTSRPGRPAGLPVSDSAAKDGARPDADPAGASSAGKPQCRRTRRPSAQS